MKIKLFTIPNVLTLMNLLCGSLAVVVALGVEGRFDIAFWLIAAAALFDFLDGFVARLLKSSSAIGVQLDSLSDMVSFGLAPTVILLAIYRTGSSLFAWWPAEGGVAIFLLVAFSALRLAKFNIDETQHTEFCGLPTPAAALFCASLGWLVCRGKLWLCQEVVVLIAVVFALLLISHIRMFALKFKGFGWKGNELRYGFLIVGVVLFVLLRMWAVPLIILLYIVVSSVRMLSKAK